VNGKVRGRARRRDHFSSLCQRQHQPELDLTLAAGGDERAAKQSAVNEFVELLSPDAEDSGSSASGQEGRRSAHKPQLTPYALI